MPKVFIIILNWNGYKDTLECLNSLENCDFKNIEVSVLLVDNASSDNSLRELKKYKSKILKIEIIENKENLGFAGGNNRGIYYALAKDAQYLLILNNDTLVHPDFLVNMVKAGKSKNFGAASPKIYFEKGYEYHKKWYKKSELGNVIWYAGGEIDWDNVYGNSRGVDEVDRGQYDSNIESDYATGSCMFINAEVFKKTGKFDERYFMYYEDTEFSARLKRLGYSILFVSQALVWHKVARSSGIGSSLNDYYISRNRLLFGFSYATFKTRIALFKESIKLLISGRFWQKIGIKDFYLRKFGKGSWN